jgi:hypothetical protein
MGDGIKRVQKGEIAARDKLRRVRTDSPLAEVPFTNESL